MDAWGTVPQPDTLRDRRQRREERQGFEAVKKIRQRPSGRSSADHLKALSSPVEDQLK